VSVTLANWREHPHSIWGFTHVERLLPVAAVAASASPAPLPDGESLDLARVSFSSEGRRLTVDEALALTHTDGFLVLGHGQVLARRYINQTPDDRHIVFSVSKSITAMLAGVLADEGHLDPDAPVTHYVPEARGSAYSDCTVRNLLDMMVSIRFTEDYLDPLGDVARYRVAMGWNPPGDGIAVEGLHSFIAGLPKAAHPHGWRFHYVSPNSDMLGWVVERAGGAPFATLLSRHLWQPMGAAAAALITLDRHGAPRSAGGICTTLDDLGRFGEMLRRGGNRVIPESWIADIRERGDAKAWSRGEMTGLFPEGRYRSQWYVPEASGNELCAIGIHGQWIYIDFEAGLVAVKQSSQPIPADEALDRLSFAMFRAIAREFR